MQMPIESLNLLVLNVGFAHHDGDWNWQGVQSPFTRIYYVTEGSARLHFEKSLSSSSEGESSSTPTIINLRPHHLYIIPAYTVHSYECDGVFCHYYLHVYEGFKKETDVFERYDLPREVAAQEGDEGLMADMCRRHPEARLPGSDPRSYDNTTKFTDYVRRYNALPLHEKMQLRGGILMLFSRFMEEATENVWTKDERMVKVLRQHLRKHRHNQPGSIGVCDEALFHPHVQATFRCVAFAIHQPQEDGTGTTDAADRGYGGKGGGLHIRVQRPLVFHTALQETDGQNTARVSEHYEVGQHCPIFVFYYPITLG